MGTNPWTSVLVLRCAHSARHLTALALTAEIEMMQRPAAKQIHDQVDDHD